jgi:hypothetical protein
MNFLNNIFGGGGAISNFSGDQRDLIDQLIQRAQQGQNPQQFEDFFQSSVVDPSLSTFNNRIAPAIQQRFIGAGIQGTPVNDSLTRAGADINSQILGQRLPALKQFQDQENFNLNKALTPQFSGQEQDFLTTLIQGIISRGAGAGTEALLGKLL